MVGEHLNMGDNEEMSGTATGFLGVLLSSSTPKIEGVFQVINLQCFLCLGQRVKLLGQMFGNPCAT